MASFPLSVAFATGQVYTAANVNTTNQAVNDLGNLALNAQTGATYTLVLADQTKIVEMNNASANTLTVPPNSSVAYPIGTQIIVLQTGAGQTSIAAGAGVTINSASAKLKLTGQWSAATLIKRATNTWGLVGDIAA